MLELIPEDDGRVAVYENGKLLGRARDQAHADDWVPRYEQAQRNLVPLVVKLREIAGRDKYTSVLNAIKPQDRPRVERLLEVYPHALYLGFPPGLYWLVSALGIITHEQEQELTSLKEKNLEDLLHLDDPLSPAWAILKGEEPTTRPPKKRKSKTRKQTDEPSAE